MALEFIVEDGTGLSNATSYISLDEMKQFWDNNMYDYSELTDEQMEYLCNQGSFYIDRHYNTLWPLGYILNSDQYFAWPRESAYDINDYAIDDDSVPQQVKDASSYVAYLYHIDYDFYPILDDTSGEIKSESVEIAGAIKESKTYVSSSSSVRVNPLRIDDILLNLTGGASPSQVLKIIRR